ncbi:acyl carrier protein [Chryseobacterium sp. RP-3-3]|uniref:Acyl carrier protein n=1 Tax=Chryseobacterium antibioticum TaxID=2728847 RepID=A0A7Y0AL90_9FLAO|nr:acyl carrier protein [Chryseobacterium antibioticum]NML69385.1 acyl carrier protein [Chryseobacterium antibioticum]
MSVNEFIRNFQLELENPDTPIGLETEYNKESYWDSLTAMAVNVMIEDNYGLDIDPEQITSFKNINELYSFIIENKK